MVPSSGIEPTSPALQAGAITRSATRAKLWPGWGPATGIVDYSVVRERFACATSVFGDEDSNLDRQGQNLLACRWPIPELDCSGTKARAAGNPQRIPGPPATEPSRQSLVGSTRPRHLRSARRGLPLADPGSRGSAGSRTPFARVRTECFAFKASDPHVELLPPVGLEPTHANIVAHLATRMHAPRSRSRNSFPLA
jgi:hypothetical protein